MNLGVWGTSEEAHAFNNSSKAGAGQLHEQGCRRESDVDLSDLTRIPCSSWNLQGQRKEQ